MNRNNVRRVSAAAVFALLFVAASVPMAGCESGGMGGLFGSKSAMDMLTPMVKDAANSYISNLTALTTSLGNLKDFQGVMEFVQKVQPTVDQLTSAYQTLSGTTGEERANLMTAFGSKISSANSAFLDQSSAVKSNRTWGQMLSPVLDKVKLFQ